MREGAYQDFGAENLAVCEGSKTLFASPSGNLVLGGKLVAVLNLNGKFSKKNTSKPTKPTKQTTQVRRLTRCPSNVLEGAHTKRCRITKLLTLFSEFIGSSCSLLIKFATKNNSERR